MTDTLKTNGNGEQARREQEFASWLAKQSTEKEEAHAQASHFKAENTGLRVTVEALQAQLTNAQSETETAKLVRDEAVARRAELEAVLKSVQLVLRAFDIAHEPLIKDIPADEVATIGGA